MVAVNVETMARQIEKELAAPGLNTPAFRKVRKRYSKELADAPPAFMIRLAVRLLKSGIFFPRAFGYEMIFHRPDVLAVIGKQEATQLGQGISGWGDTDTLGSYVIGPAWRDGKVTDKDILGWAESPDLWWRRTALVATTHLNLRSKGGTGDTKRTLMVCRKLVDDHEDMVVKALSWALRDLVVWDPAAVEAFLAKYEDRLAARVKREVHNKLTTGLKNPKPGR